MSDAQGRGAAGPMGGRRLSSLLASDLSSNAAQSGVMTLRIVAGVMIATLHGWHKIVQGWDFVTTGTAWPLLDDTVQLGFPFPVVSAALAALIQLAGGWLLAIGAATRIAAFFVMTTMLTALLFNVRFGGPDAQLAGLYALVCGAFVLIGGGRWSVDGLVAPGRRPH